MAENSEDSQVEVREVFHYDDCIIFNPQSEPTEVQPGDLNQNLIAKSKQPKNGWCYLGPGLSHTNKIFVDQNYNQIMKVVGTGHKFKLAKANITGQITNTVEKLYSGATYTDLVDCLDRSNAWIKAKEVSYTEMFTKEF